MRVLMINVVCGIRSTGRICTDLATALEAQGHEVKIAYGRENVPEQFQKYAVKIGSDLDVKLHGVKARIFDGAGFGSKAATEKFIKWVKEYDPDVIHLHNIHGYYINVEVLFDYLKKSEKKVIWTLHDCWSFTGHTPYCDAKNCKRWVKGCHNCPLIKEYPASLIDRSKQNWLKKKEVFTGVKNMTIITPSQWLESWVKRSFLKEYPVRVINNGIDVSQFYPSKSQFRKNNNLENECILLGVATIFDDMKGYSDFIKLSKMLDASYKIVLVGLTKTQIEKLPNNILGIERTANVQELSEIYTAADIFLNLTYCDSFGQVNIEAALCGTPIVAYDTGGCKESVGDAGIVVEKGNLEKVIEAITEIKKMDYQFSMNRIQYDTCTSVMNYLSVYESNADSNCESPKRVLFLTNVPSPYRVMFFNELGKKCDLTVLYQKHSSSERNSKWKAESIDTFRSVYLKGVSTGVDNAFCPEVIKFLNRNYDALVICGNASPTEIFAIEWCKLNKIPYCIEGDGAFVKKGNLLKEMVKKHLIGGGQLFFSTCKEHDRYYAYYGADSKRIVRYRFSSLLEADILNAPISKEEKSALRKELGIRESKVVLAIGQFIHRKGFDVLINAASSLDCDTGIYIIGDNPTEEYMNLVKENRINTVHFEGFKTKTELRKFYLAADVFVLPTREDIWGLVVNEAMGYGLPVITTDKCNAGMELIENGKNGFVIPTDSVDDLAKAIIEVLNKDAAMGISSIEKIQGYTIETMVKDHMDIFNEYA